MPEPIIRIIKAPDDPQAFRISCGGRPDVGYYATYRGDLESCKLVMRLILKAMDTIGEEPKPIDAGPKHPEMPQVDTITPPSAV